MDADFNQVSKMKRTQVQLDEPTYELLRKKAFERCASMSAVIRDALEEYLGAAATPPRQLEDFRFIASGRRRQGKLAPISERHDEALAEDFRP